MKTPLFPVFRELPERAALLGLAVGGDFSEWSKGWPDVRVGVLSSDAADFAGGSRRKTMPSHFGT